MLEPINTELAELQGIKKLWHRRLIKLDRDSAIRVFIRTEKVDLRQLRAERQRLLELKDGQEPRVEELAELGRSMHPYYVEDIETRLAELEADLG